MLKASHLAGPLAAILLMFPAEPVAAGSGGMFGAFSRADSLRLAAHTYMRMKRPKDAAFDFGVLAQEGLAEPRDYVWLGEALVEAEQMEDAEEAFRTAIRLGREAEGYNGIGLIHLNTPKRRMTALDYFQRALRKEPELVDATYNMAKTYVHLRPREAEEVFRQVLAIEPDHEDAYYQIGLLREDDGNLQGAAEAYQGQLKVLPAHGGAAYRLARLMLASGERQEAVTVFEELAAGGDEMENDAYLELARVKFEEGDLASAQAFFDRYISALPSRERRPFTEFELIADRSSKRLFDRSMAYEKKDLTRRFWVFQDPAPLTPENERLLEHYARVAHAREHFSHGKFPWDARGDVYVRMGPPDHVSRSNDIQAELDPMVQNARINFANRTYLNLSVVPGLPTFPVDENDKWEYWVYVGIERGIELTFTSRYSDNRFVFAPVPAGLTGRAATDLLVLHGNMVVQNLAESHPSVYEPDLPAFPIDFYYYPADFRGPGPRTRLEIYYGFPASEVLKLQGAESDDLVALDRGLVLFDESLREVHRITDQIFIRAPTPDQLHRGAFIPGVMPVDLAPGTYQMALQIRDGETGRTQVYREELQVEDYARDSALRLSDIELAFSISDVDSANGEDDPFVKSGLKVIPMSSKSFRRDQHAFLYFEIYNLTKNEFGQAKYGVDYRVRSSDSASLPVKILRGLGQFLRLVENDREVVISYEGATSRTEEVMYVELDLSASEPGGQSVTVTVTDSLSGRKASKDIAFDIAEYR